MGAEVSDKVSGFRGIITGRCEWISGVINYEVTAKITDPSKKPEPGWVSENLIQLEGNDAEVMTKTLVGEETNGLARTSKRDGFM